MPGKVDAAFWAERAEEARAEAEQLTDPKAKALMLRIAEHYIELAIATANRQAGRDDLNKR